ncbi:carbon-nitrogen family hydrolase [Listeria ivanovii]|uniref:CN hydrolase domain-containing protein n=2 Tax=Listeria ivanovii TaxID=1638 RepID=G2ZA62_LISIP|nr:carbon-nitrogen family hydrolase [Listeria ivanovii]AHI54870.1 hydrolase [Listeria ivanovii WSLC3009]AIS64332.1 hydrolase [Listeria ivanovii subsp. ivanovii]MBC1760290.1 carbon-nitrogen family hydrolase [Listeria ivanovii]MBK3915344.1 carbon-nitrogen family hydrolase [Listeria ivanovii subsp. ivanovii]MBK3922472.1 carbon-nitrogen family hydrolase [Listeria ivanovii subsp. ivanovii]
MWKLALCQTDVAFKYPDANYARMEKAVVEAAKNGADVAILPEMWNTGYALSELSGLADLNGERTKEFLTNLAEKHQIAIIGGSVAISEGSKFSNTMYAFDRYGGLLSSYKKVHLFQLMNEHLFIEAGNDTNLFRLNDVSCAGFICYDIRFPEWIRKHTSEGSEVLFISAQWPAERITQWKQLLIARAIENQAFIVAVNRVGDDPQNHFNGHSLVIDPLGNVVAQAGEGEENLYAEIDLSLVAETRGIIPIFTDRRPELY